MMLLLEYAFHVVLTPLLRDQNCFLLWNQRLSSDISLFPWLWCWKFDVVSHKCLIQFWGFSHNKFFQNTQLNPGIVTSFSKNKEKNLKAILGIHIFSPSQNLTFWYLGLKTKFSIFFNQNTNFDLWILFIPQNYLEKKKSSFSYSQSSFFPRNLTLISKSQEKNRALTLL